MNTVWRTGPQDQRNDRTFEAPFCDPHISGGSMTSAELPGVAPDVLVVGAGNAALCAAISAHQNGARVLMLEAAPFEERGGNSHFTGGAFRFAFAGVDDLLRSEEHTSELQSPY